ncbi:MAG: hypothetical protein K8J31_02780 [Anaerolineae bacterium]|nr:hypothetical protein [Anaerolineae bacterium]
MIPNDLPDHPLSPELIYIRWNQTPQPGSGVDAQFLSDLQTLLEDAPQPVYFISDLRRGRITDMRTIQMLAQLARHKNWAGSTAFSQDPITSILVQSFRAFTRTDSASNDHIETTPEAALNFLNTLKPGLVDGIDWDAVIREEAE